MYLMFILPVWVITSKNLLPDNLRLYFIFPFLLFIFALKLPISNFKRWSLILAYHSDLIQFQGELSIVFPGLCFEYSKEI